MLPRQPARGFAEEDKPLSPAPRRGPLTRLCLGSFRKQELLSGADVTVPERPLSPPLTAPPTMKVSGCAGDAHGAAAPALHGRAGEEQRFQRSGCTGLGCSGAGGAVGGFWS